MTKTDYQFNGCYKDNALTKQFDGTVTSSLTLYAKWLIIFINDDQSARFIQRVAQTIIPVYEADSRNSVIIVPYNLSDSLDGYAFYEYLLKMFYVPIRLYEGHLNLMSSIGDVGVIVYYVDAENYHVLEFWKEYFSYNNGALDFLIEILEADENVSIQNHSNYQTISIDDLLTSGTFDLLSYAWHNGLSINVLIEITGLITNASKLITFSITFE